MHLEAVRVPTCGGKTPSQSGFRIIFGNMNMRWRRFDNERQEKKSVAAPAPVQGEGG